MTTNPATRNPNRRPTHPEDLVMKSLLKTSIAFAAGALVTVAAMQLAPSPAISQGAGIAPVPPQCTGSRMQVPTARGLEWKQLVVCPQD